MTTAIPDLWPQVIEADPILTPVLILRQQAVNLGDKTHQVVVGEVETTAMRDLNSTLTTSAIGPVEMRHDFFISAPLIGYRIPVLQVLHGLQAYPTLIRLTRLNEPGKAASEVVANSPEAFINILRTALADESVLRAIRSLLAHSRDAEPVAQ